MATRSLFVFTCTAVCLVGANLSDRVLVVHNGSAPESIAVANYYVAKRQIPETNRCEIRSASDTFVSMYEYQTAIQAPIQSCLNSIGPSKILYIVMTYGVPYGISDKRRFALDSFVADVWDRYTTQVFTIVPAATHPYYADNQAEGEYFIPFLSLAAYRNTDRPTLIYSVWRLDGPSAALAQGMVDKAILSEQTGGPVGQGCFDWRTSLATYPDTGAGSGDWDIYRASGLLRAAGIATLEDSESPEITSCPNAAFYTGWYSLFYTDAFAWNTGAIGWHIDSASAYNPRGGVSWAPSAISKGITITSGALDEPYLEGMVRSSGTFRNLLEGANVGDAFLRNTRWLKWEILYFGDPLYTPFAGGRAPFNSTTAFDSLSFSSPRTIVGGYQQATATINLATPAPAGGRLFLVSSYYAGAVASHPTIVFVPPGQSKTTFLIGGNLRSYAIDDLITATSGSLRLRNSLTVTQLLSSVVLAINTVRGGQGLPALVRLNARTGASPVAVNLKSNNPSVLIPTSVTVPANSNGVVFFIGTSRVSAKTDVTITATHAGSTTNVVLSLTP